ncbi:MAG: aldo/keto reductase [Sphaerochaetaceae bacterium]|nr:aldo/keto reductase [Sphaerochaetaceae bacterium]
MYYNEFKGEKISALGLGCMRLPCREDKSIDTEELQKMVDYAISHGVNFFDTAYVYHGGMSEIEIGKALSKYPRDSYYLCDKYPGHSIQDTYDVKTIFERQLERCGVDYFDFYLLHNAYENSFPVYEDEKWGIIDYLLEQKKQGRIRHLGLSSHASPENLEAFLDRHPGVFEYCLIETNYLDWTLQDAKSKYENLSRRGFGIGVMEPLRGGRLATAPDLEKPVESAFRFLQGKKNLTVILSGMSSFEQMAANIEIFRERRPLSEEEEKKVFEVAEKLKNAVPCTACRYCMDGCPMGLEIPRLIATYNDLKFQNRATPVMWMDNLPADKLPSACLSCGACMQICPQKINIPQVMQDFDELLSKTTRWAEICRQRAEEEKKLNEKLGK